MFAVLISTHWMEAQIIVNSRLTTPDTKSNHHHLLLNMTSFCVTDRKEIKPIQKRSYIKRLSNTFFLGFYFFFELEIKPSFTKNMNIT